jgi:hypothetical protein
MTDSFDEFYEHADNAICGMVEDGGSDNFPITIIVWRAKPANDRDIDVVMLSDIESREQLLGFMEKLAAQSLTEHDCVTPVKPTSWSVWSMCAERAISMRLRARE